MLLWSSHPSYRLEAFEGYQERGYLRPVSFGCLSVFYNGHIHFSLCDLYCISLNRETSDMQSKRGGVLRCFLNSPCPHGVAWRWHKHNASSSRCNSNTEQGKLSSLWSTQASVAIIFVSTFAFLLYEMSRISWGLAYNYHRSSKFTFAWSAGSCRITKNHIAWIKVWMITILFCLASRVSSLGGCGLGCQDQLWHADSRDASWQATVVVVEVIPLFVVVFNYMWSYNSCCI